MFKMWIIAAVWMSLAIGNFKSQQESGGGGPAPMIWDLRLIGDSNSSSGELQMYVIERGWVSFCSEGFGYFEAQVACTVLGYSFFMDTYPVAQPEELEDAVTSVSCADEISNGPDASMAYCDPVVEMTHCGSDTLVGLVCDDHHYSSVEGLALIAFYSEFSFQYIDPHNTFYFSNCRVADFFCSGVHLVNISANTYLQTSVNIWTILSQGGAQVGCGLHCASKLTVEHSCKPALGDVYLGEVFCNETTIFDGEGELTLYNTEGEWVEVCADSFSYLEAHVVCTQLFYPFVEQVYSLERSGHLAIESIRCTGAELSVRECSIQSSNSSCNHTVGLTCGGTWIYGSNEGYATVLFEGTQPLRLTLIVPDHDYYSNNCTIGSSDICPGIYYLESNSTGVELLINSSQVLTTEEATCFIPELKHADVPGVGNCNESPNTGNPAKGASSSSSTTAVAAGVSCAVVAILLLAIVMVVFYRRRKKRRLRKQVTKMWPQPLLESGTTKGTLNALPVEYRAITFKHKPVRRKSSVFGTSVPDTNWEIPFACITMEEEVGSGAYGSIHRGVIACEHQGDSIEVAIKLLKSGAVDSERRALVLEINMMKDIGYHRHVVSMLACCTKGECLALVMEYIPYGNLQSFLKKKRAESEDPYAMACKVTDNHRYTPDQTMGMRLSDSLDSMEVSFTNSHEPPGVCKAAGSLSMTELLQFARQITLGMEFLSSLKVVHRDLAARNILIDKDLIMKVSDFGLSRDIYSDECYHMESVKDRLPVRWMAPESIIDRDFTAASDVWSFGITLWEIVTYASFPYFNLSNSEVIESVNTGYRMPKPRECSDQVYDIMLACWAARPKDRPAFTEIRKMLDALLDTGEYTSLLSLSVSQNAVIGLETITEGHESA